MILITGRFQVDPAQREAFLQFVHELVPRERRQAGCLNFDVYEDAITHNSFLMLEQWEDSDVLDAHSESLEFETNDAKLDSFVLGEASWDEYEF